MVKRRVEGVAHPRGSGLNLSSRSYRRPGFFQMQSCAFLDSYQIQVPAAFGVGSQQLGTAGAGGLYSMGASAVNGGSSSTNLMSAHQQQTQNQQQQQQQMQAQQQGMQMQVGGPSQEQPQQMQCMSSQQQLQHSSWGAQSQPGFSQQGPAHQQMGMSQDLQGQQINNINAGASEV